MKTPRPLARLEARAQAAGRRAALARVITTQTAAQSDDSDGTADSTAAELWLYGTVGGYWWGFDSDSVADALRSLGDIDDILVRLHSFGGSAIEGIAIANLLANHPATVRIVVDGMAASAASMIALSGEELIMSPGSQFMIHDAWTWASGNAAELRAAAEWVDKQSQNYAETYAHRAAGTAAQWRERMTANGGEGTWYTAQEAVDAGLAARVENIASASPPPPAPEPIDLDEDTDLAAAARFDVEVLLHPAARAAWTNWRSGNRAHQPPTASAEGSTQHPEGGPAVAFSNEQLTTMRTQLGVAEDADEATILAALAEALDERAEPTPAVPEGMALIDATVLDELRVGAAAGRTAQQQLSDQDRDGVIEAAITEGRITPARREHFADLWQADPEGTRVLLTSTLQPGLVPTSELGHAQAADDSDLARYDDLAGFAAGMGLTEEDLR